MTSPAMLHFPFFLFFFLFFFCFSSFVHIPHFRYNFRVVCLCFVYFVFKKQTTLLICISYLPLYGFVLCPVFLVFQAELQSDLEEILRQILKLIQACVDVLSSSSWLSPALIAMEMSQMIVQAAWASDSYLKQIPHMDTARLQRAADKECDTVLDLTDLEDAERDEILKMDQAQVMDVARFCNRYPSIEVDFAVDDSDDIHAGGACVVKVKLERDDDDGSQLGPVIAPHFPVRKMEGWWLCVGEPATNSLLAIKRVPLQNEANVKLEFVAPDEGAHNLKLYLMADAYQGCDQEFEFDLTCLEAEEEEESSDEEDDAE